MDAKGGEMRRRLLVMYTLFTASLLATVLALLHCAELDFVYDNPCDETGINYQGCHDWTITFDPNGGTLTTTSVTTGVGDTLGSLPTPARTGYTFNGWYTASTSGTKVTEDKKYNGNTTIYAQWTLNPYTNNYKTVMIGTQTWMAENLDYNVEGSVCYNNSADSCTKYGRLYNWTTAMDVAANYAYTTWGGSDVNHRGICPVGWHLPSSAEWTTLTSFVGSSAGRKLKSQSGWYNNGNGTDEYGFSALPGGYGNSGGYFNNAGYYGYWWSATEGDAYYA
jgi:uncharacterized protein (TIGR02145 family)/uncharacterized repeat protein (TIGR02543 family)